MIWYPFEDLSRMHEEMDRVFGRVFTSSRPLLERIGGKELAKRSQFRAPAADIKETENNVIATFELPGADKEDIELNVTDDMIEVKVEKKAEKELKKKGIYSYESRSSQFYRSLPLPAEVKADKAEAGYKDGVLKVEIPKAKRIEHKKGKRIEIK